MKTWNKESILNLLDTNNAAVERAILVVFRNQTSDEQRQETVKYHNNTGFTASDAHRGTYYAKWILAGKHLTRHHLERARKMAKKYHRQLLVAIAEKAQ